MPKSSVLNANTGILLHTPGLRLTSSPTPRHNLNPTYLPTLANATLIPTPPVNNSSNSRKRNNQNKRQHKSEKHKRPRNSLAMTLFRVSLLTPLTLQIACLAVKVFSWRLL
jgi:hypothetical protein